VVSPPSYKSSLNGVGEGTHSTNNGDSSCIPAQLKDVIGAIPSQDSLMEDLPHPQWWTAQMETWEVHSKGNLDA
jgi:hypothetical protein